MNYIVVHAEQSYDYVESVDFVAGFEDEEMANAFLQGRREVQQLAWKARLDYIAKWVDAIEVPETDYQGWLEFLKPYFQGRYVMPADFKSELKLHLANNPIKLANYNPPPADYSGNNLYIVNLNPEQ